MTRALAYALVAAVATAAGMLGVLAYGEWIAQPSWNMCSGGLDLMTLIAIAGLVVVTLAAALRGPAARLGSVLGALVTAVVAAPLLAVVLAIAISAVGCFS